MTFREPDHWVTVAPFDLPADPGQGDPAAVAWIPPVMSVSLFVLVRKARSGDSLPVLSLASIRRNKLGVARESAESFLGRMGTANSFKEVSVAGANRTST